MKLAKRLLLVAAAMAALCTTAFAAGHSNQISDLAKDTTVTIIDSEGNPMGAADSNTVNFTPEKLSVTYAGEDVQNGQQYLVFFMVGNTTTPTEKNLIYIDQTAAANGKVEFVNSVYPANMRRGTLCLAGPGGLKQIAKVDLLYELGNYDDDEMITAFDAMDTLRASVHLNSPNDIEFKAADVGRDGVITAFDAMDILSFSVERINHFEKE